jgi:hypothetical protein
MPKPTLCRSSLVVAAVACVVMVVLAAPGLVRDQSLSTHPTFYDTSDVFEHGWPIVYLERYVDEEFMFHHGKPLPGPSWASAENWTFWKGEDHVFLPGRLALDIAAALLIVALATAAWEWRRRRRANVWQLRLSEFLAVVAVAAGGLGWLAYQRDEASRERPHETALEEAFLIHEETPTFTTGRTPNAPQWVLRLVGSRWLPDCLWRCAMVHVTCNGEGYDGFGNVAAHLQQLRRLRVLTFEIPLRPGQIPFDQVARLSQIRCLELEWIVLHDWEIDWQLRPEEIETLPRLDRLILPSRSVLSEGAEQALRERLPDCAVVFADELYD